jgi:hypothetical protein
MFPIPIKPNVAIKPPPNFFSIISAFGGNATGYHTVGVGALDDPAENQTSMG